MTQLASPLTVNVEDKRDRALDLRKEGKTYQAIATELGLQSKSRAHELVQEALQDLRENNREKARQVRDLELVRLDAMIEKLWSKIDQPRVVDSILRIMQRRADLLGLDAPKNIRLGGEGGGPIQTADATPVVQLTDQERLRRLRDFGLEGILKGAGNGNGNGNGASHN